MWTTLVKVCVLWLADLTICIYVIADVTSGVELLGTGIGHYGSAAYNQILLGSFQTLPVP